MSDDLLAIRGAIDALDDKLVNLMATRAALVAQAWTLKDQMDLKHFDQNREAAILASVERKGETLRLPPDKIRAIWQQLIGLTPIR